MTAPEPLSDLSARLLAAIDETERIARATTGGGHAGWHSQAWVELRTKAGADPHWWQIAVQGGGSDTMQPRPPVDSRPDFRHMARNDPPTVLRRCAADRRTIERHQRAVQLNVCFDYDNYRDVEHCAACTLGNGCDHCISWTGESFISGPAVLWPCDTLRDLAEVYGISVEAA